MNPSSALHNRKSWTPISWLNLDAREHKQCSFYVFKRWRKLQQITEMLQQARSFLINQYYGDQFNGFIFWDTDNVSQWQHYFAKWYKSNRASHLLWGDVWRNLLVFSQRSVIFSQLFPVQPSVRGQGPGSLTLFWSMYCPQSAAAVFLANCCLYWGVWQASCSLSVLLRFDAVWSILLLNLIFMQFIAALCLAGHLFWK